jgi:hypothetical protein
MLKMLGLINLQYNTSQIQSYIGRTLGVTRHWLFSFGDIILLGVNNGSLETVHRTKNK